MFKESWKGEQYIAEYTVSPCLAYARNTGNSIVSTALMQKHCLFDRQMIDIIVHRAVCGDGSSFTVGSGAAMFGLHYEYE